MDTIQVWSGFLVLIYHVLIKYLEKYSDTRAFIFFISLHLDNDWVSIWWQEPPLELLDTHLSQYSYVGGHRPTQADRAVLASGCVPPNLPTTLPNLRRWAAHMASFSCNERQAFPPHTDGCKVRLLLCSLPLCTLTTILQFSGVTLFLKGPVLCPQRKCGIIHAFQTRLFCLLLQLCLLLGVTELCLRCLLTHTD